MMGWAICQYDRALKENRLVAVYLNPEDASADAIAMSNLDNQPSVEMFEIHEHAEYTAIEPVLEQNSSDFDTPIHVPGEVR